MDISQEELFEQYTAATNKSVFIKAKAKELDVTGSDVIAVLLRTGYKFAELERASKPQYVSAVNKYNKWLEEGGREPEKKEYEKPVLEEVKVPEESEPPVNDVNPAEVAKLKARLQELIRDKEILDDDFETVNRALAEECGKRKVAEAKLRKAERYILNSLYAGIDDNEDQ